MSPVPTPYHLLTREDPRHRGWQLPAAGAMTLGAFVVAATLIGPGPQDPVGRPLALAVDLGTVALLVPFLLGALWLTGSPALPLIWSVDGRVRWGWWSRCCAITFGVVATALVLGSLLPGSAVAREAAVPSMAAWSGVLVALVLVPPAALGVELVFRGYLLQLIGTVVPVAWIGVAASAFFFAALHGGSTTALVQAGLLGLAAGVLTQRTGGLEAAVALQVAHEVLLLVLEAGEAVSPPAAQSELGLAAVVPTVVAVLAVGSLVEWQVRSTGLSTRRSEAAAAPVPGGGPGAETASGPPRVRPQAPPYPGEIGDDWGR